MPPQQNGPDFSLIDSLAKAEDLFRRGDLEKLFLMPPAFGGVDNPQNVVFVPIGIAAVKSDIDENIIKPLADQRKITQYSAVPKYQGASFIPVAIKVTASNPGEFTTLIKVWGNALQ